MTISITKDLEAIQLLRKEYRARAHEIQTYKDDYLSPAGLEEARAKKLQALREDGKQALNRIQLSVDTDRNWLKSKAEQAMPKPSGSTADAWARVQMLLDAGRSLNQILENASDVLTLQAIREWGPTYLESKRTITFDDGLAGSKPVDTAPLMNSIGKRWAELSGKETELSDYFNSLGGFAKYDVLARDTSNIFEGRGGNPLEVSIEAELAGRAASVDLSDNEAS